MVVFLEFCPFCSCCFLTPVRIDFTSSLCSTGMPDFLEKLHTAALRAKNMDFGVHDYVSIAKPTQPTQERLGADNAHTRGSSQIYAWASGHSDWCTVAKWPRTGDFINWSHRKPEPSIPKINLCHLTNCTSCQTERSHPSLFVLLVYFLFL